MLLIDGVKYDHWTPPNEDEFERLAGEHTEEIFGKDAKYFDLKHKLASKSGTGSIPDGYVISLGEKPEVQIIEMELASHSLSHIVSQMVNIINGIENPSTQQKICNAIDDGINEDDIFETKLAKAIRPVTIHRFLSDSFSNTLPTINIIIDESLPKLEEAIRKISAAYRIIEFQTFTRGGVGLLVHAHMFEPVYRVIRPTQTIPPQITKVKPDTSSKDILEITISNISFAKFHLFYIPKDRRHFFPGYKVPFALETDLNTIETRVSSAPAGTQVGDLNKGSYFQSNLGEWYKRHPDIKIGDKVRITAIESMKRYRLELLR